MNLAIEDIFQAVKKDLQEAERLRNKNVPFALLLLLLALAAPVWLLTKMALILIHHTGEDISEWLFVGVLVFSIIAILAIHGVFFRRVHILFRERVVSKMVEMIGDDAHYDPGEGVDRALGKQCRLLPDFSVWGDKDHVSGHLDGHPFECCKITLKDSGRKLVDLQASTNQLVLFKGVFVHLQAPHPFSAPVWIVPKRINFRYQLPQLKKMDDRQELNSGTLRGDYQLHTTDEATARHVFSGPVLQVINDQIARFDEKGISKKLRFAFFGEHICVAFPRKKGLFALPWLPFFTRMDTLAFVEKQWLVLEAMLDLRQALYEVLE